MKAFIYVGRFCPFHKGHERVVSYMLKRCTDEKADPIIFIGSATQELSIRNVFTINQRARLISKLYGDMIKILYLPDYKLDSDWIAHIQRALAIGNYTELVFFGGCAEDLEIYSAYNFKVEVANRFEIPELNISATQVRDYLIYGKDISSLVNSELKSDIELSFETNFNLLKRR